MTEKTVLQSAISAFGIATIGMTWIFAPVADLTHNAVYHWSGRAASIYIPILVDFFLCWLLLTFLLRLVQRSRKHELVLWTAIATLFPWVILKNATALRDINYPHWVSMSLLGFSCAVLLLLLTLWRSKLKAGFPLLQHGMTTVFRAAALSGVLIVVEVLWFSYRAHDLNRLDRGHRHAVLTSQRHHAHRTRILWIVFDELSHQQLYERRFVGLKLPAFDELAQQSTLFTQVVSAGTGTEQILPSLIAGDRYDQIRSSPSGQLFVHRAKSSWREFDPQNTVFHDALREGYSTGVVGWYNPYCRFLYSVLDRCTWAFSEPLLNHMSVRASIAENIGAPFHSMQKARGELHIDDFKELSLDADDLATDPNVDFAFLHLPVPHPGGIYDRQTSQFVAQGASYLDNLALADRYLGHLRELMERSGLWDDTAVIVMGDHSWRTKLIWANSQDWTAEERRASDGDQFDPRPAYLVKLPRQHTAARIDFSFDAMETRRLLDGILSGRVRTPEELAAWAADSFDNHAFPPRRETARFTTGTTTSESPE